MNVTTLTGNNAAATNVNGSHDDADEDGKATKALDPKVEAELKAKVNALKAAWLGAHVSETAALADVKHALELAATSKLTAESNAADRLKIEHEIGEAQVARGRKSTLISMADGELYRVRKARAGAYSLEAAGDAD